MQAEKEGPLLCCCLRPPVCTSCHALPPTSCACVTLLPCRVQDKPAQLLYAKAGYEEVAADLFLVRLLGLDQRRLLRKRL